MGSLFRNYFTVHEQLLLHAILLSCYHLAPSTSIVYEGKSIPEASPAYMNRRKMQDTLQDEKMKDYPKGLGWEGELDYVACGLLADLSLRTSS